MKNNILIHFILFLIFGSNLGYSQNKQPIDFVPEGYVIFEEIQGDLDKDGIPEIVLIIKATDQNKIINDEHHDHVDRNRRGIIVLKGQQDKFELITKNYDCFSSENEDGGVYFPPDMQVQIENGILYIYYSHGRYGFWKYTFRHKTSDFELIGFDSSQNDGPIVNKEISLNFLTKKKLEVNNINEHTEDSGDEIFEETWSNIEVKDLIKLSEIEDFDDLFFY